MNMNKNIDNLAKASRRWAFGMLFGFIFIALALLYGSLELQKLQKTIETKRDEIKALDDSIKVKNVKLYETAQKLADALKYLEAAKYDSAKEAASEGYATATGNKDLDWFAVLASYKELNWSTAKNHAKKIAAKVKAQGLDYPVEIYKTKISKNYAVTIGGRLDKSRALELSKLARKNGWSSDSFAQIDREWDFVERIE